MGFLNQARDIKFLTECLGVTVDTTLHLNKALTGVEFATVREVAEMLNADTQRFFEQAKENLYKISYNDMNDIVRKCFIKHKIIIS